MEPPAGKSKLLLIALSGILLSVAAAAAPQASISGAGDQTIWANSVDSDAQLTYSCTDSQLRNITVEDSDETIQGLSGPSGEVDTSQIDEVQNLDENLGPMGFTVFCGNLTMNDSKKVVKDSVLLEVKKLLFSLGSDTKGYFGTGQRLEDSEFQTPFSIEELKVKQGNIPAEKVSDSGDISFSFPGNDIGIENGEWDLKTRKLYPIIGQDFNPSQEEVQVEVEYSGLEEKVEVTKSAPIKVYPYRPEILGGSTQRKISYDDLGDFSYTLDVVPGRDVSAEVNQEDFKLTVRQITGEGGVVYEDKQWFESSQPGGDGEYRISLSKIPSLTLGEKYEFKTYIDEAGGETPIDTIRVVNNLQFSGVVRDSSGGPIRTEMVLKDEDSENIPVNTGSDGTYSADIENRDFDSISLKFFDRGLSAPDTNFQLQDVELGENPNLGFSSEAIRYQYWENPVSDVEGLQEVNMMAGKFSHDIRGGAEAFMKFDPQSVNFENLKVYECTLWNFQGRKCMGSWKAVRSNDVSINLATNRVYLQNLDLYEMSEEVTGGSNKTILMNAYVVGTSSELGLEGDVPITVSSERLAANEQLSVSGTVVDGEGDTVENVDVDVELRKDGEAFRTLEASSGPNGGFEASGKAPSEDGRYSIEVSVSKDLYQSYSVESSKTLEVFYERGVEISSAGTPDLRLGEPTTLEFSLSNTGQRPVKDVSISVSGLEDEYYEKVRVPEELESGATNDVRVRISLPSDFCPAPCANPPVIDIEAVGNSAGEELSAQTTIYTSINRDTSENATSGEPDHEQEQTPQTSERSSTDNNSTKGSLDRIGSMTGNFLKRQSSVNIALGLIMVFTMILALAVRKKKDDDSRSRASGRARPVSTDGSRVNKPEVAAAEEESEVHEDSGDEVNSSPGEDGEQVEKDEDDEGGEEESFVCDECGEEFDTEEALDMHREINGEH